MGHQTWLAERREKILGVCGDKFVRQESEMAMQKEKENLGLLAAKNKKNKKKKIESLEKVFHPEPVVSVDTMGLTIIVPP